MARADSSVIISRFRPRVNPFFNLFLTLFDSFSSKSGFSRDKSCIFLDIAEKMQSLSLLRLIEKFAEIHRQVSLCSLTTFSESLRDMGTMGDFIPQAPSLGTSPQTPSPLRAIFNV